MLDGHSTLYWMHPGWLWTLAALALALAVFRRTSERPLRTVAGPALLVALLLGALAEPGYQYATAERFTVLAVDESASIRGAAGERASQFVARSIELAGDDQLAVLPFAGRPGKLHEGAGLAETRHRSASGTDLEPLASNPARALLAAAAQVPADKAGQIVLLSDGRQTDGDLLKAAVGAGLPVSVVPLEALAGPEVCLVELRVPASAEPRDDFEADAVIESNHDDSGTLSLRRDGQLVAERAVELKAGRNVVPLRPVMPAADRALWVAELTGFRDTSAENNRRSAIVFAGARPRVLILADDAPAAGRMAAALDSQGFEASTLAPAEWAQAPPALEHLGVLILLDLGIKELPDGMQRTLERFARDGGGVLAIGGSSTFAAVDYRQTVLEGILPVGALAEAEPRQASLALVLVIDKSGSMGDDQRLELAKLAARRVVNLLAEQDQLGVLAFATDSSWVTPIAPDTDKPELEKRIDALRAGGGTNMYPAMQKAALALSEAVADHKQLILLTDGISVPGDFSLLARQLASQKVGISTVAIGGEADLELLAEIAGLTGGHAYHCANPADIPRVVVAEAAAATAATASHAGPLVLHQLPRLNVADVPPLSDAVATSAKPAAEVLLITATGDPLLCWWRFGSGVTLAYTARFAVPEQPAVELADRQARFWARIVRQALVRPGRGSWDVQLVRSPGRVRLVADALASDGGLASDLRPTVDVTTPGGRQPALALPLVAPGRYQTDIVLDAVGHYDFELHLDGPSGGQIERRALVVDYPDEWRLAAPDRSLLGQVAQLSGGRYDPTPEQVLAPDGRTAAGYVPLWPYFLLAAVGVLLVEAALQRRSAAASRAAVQNRARGIG